MQKLICTPGQRATIVRCLPGHVQAPGLIGRIVQVKRLLTQQENIWVKPGYPCWLLMVPIVAKDGRVYEGVYDYCLAPLPDEGDVFEYDHEVELIDEQNKELSDVSPA